MTQTVSLSRNAPLLPKQFIWIDGVRGLAALAVVISHYHHFFLLDYQDRANIPSEDSFPWAWLFAEVYRYGGVAVQVFWVISGFVFTHVYIHRSTTLRSFAGARIARLYPLHLATLLFVAAVQATSLTWAGHWQIYGNNDIRHFGLQLLFASNWTTLSRGLTFNGPIWSVSLEMVAYGIFFLTLLQLRRFRLFLAAPLAILLFGVGLATSLDLPGIRHAAFVCAGYFFLGTCTYLVLLKFSDLRLASGALVTIALASWAAGMAMDLGHLATASAAVLIVYVIALADIHFVSVASGMLKRLGDMSYSIYLVHVPIQMVVLLMADTIFGGTRAFAYSLLTLPLYLAATIVIADLAYRRFEYPASQWLRRALLRTQTG